MDALVGTGIRTMDIPLATTCRFWGLQITDYQMVVLTLSLNLQYARSVMINFGTVAYFAAGAYAYAIVTQEPPSGLDQYAVGLDCLWWASVLGAGVAAAVFAVVTGGPTVRLRGAYLALTTFAFAEVLHSVLLNERRIGNGSVGMANVKQPDLALIETAYLYAGAALAPMLATMLPYWRLLSSPYGRAMDAIRDDETTAEETDAEAVGKDAACIRFQIFVISAVPVGLAGAPFARITTLVAPSLFTAAVTIFVWIALILWGERTIIGAILGTLALATVRMDGRTTENTDISKAFLTLDRVIKCFGGVRAVGGDDGLSFSVRRGAFLGLIGPNGAGKSTTFNLISGVLTSDCGTVTLDGQPLAATKPARRRSRRGSGWPTA